MARVPSRIRTRKTRLPSSARSILSLFKKTAREVPAYQHFLDHHKVRPEAVKKISEIPPISKQSYLRRYPYNELFANGSLHSPHVLTATSGSTGEPFYFARGESIDERAAHLHARFFDHSSLSKSEPTLAIVCFGMGVWIGGLITYEAFRRAARDGSPISVITPGINKPEIFKILQRLAPSYKQVILAGYPPFIKDVLDEAHEEGIDLSSLNIAIVFAAEAFSESFRDYICARAHIQNPYTDTMNIYGSADLGAMAAETPLSILIRRMALKLPDAYKSIFGSITKIPTLAQFDPAAYVFEEVDGSLYVSGDSAMPLVRYDIGDRGGVRTLAEFERAFEANGVSLSQTILESDIPPSLLTLPFVFVYERSDLSTTLYGLQIYPESLRETLYLPTFTPFVTGRFSLASSFDADHNQQLDVHVELKRGKVASRSLSALMSKAFTAALLEKNAEFRELRAHLGRRASPHVRFWPHEDPRYFRRDIKQKWVVDQ